jgi:hypothetical protein
VAEGLQGGKYADIPQLRAATPSSEAWCGPYIRGGATFFDDPDFVLQASFEGAPGGVGTFRMATNTDDVVADVSAGVDVIGSRGASLRLYYDGRFGDTVEKHAGGIKASLPF